MYFQHNKKNKKIKLLPKYDQKKDYFICMPRSTLEEFKFPVLTGLCAARKFQ
jgi:hypothetical protein